MHNGLVVEVCHNADAPSGYGALARQLSQAIKLQGCNITEHGNRYMLDRMQYNPKTVELVRTKEGLRYRTVETDERAIFGTRARKWTMDHDLIYPDNDADPDIEVTRDAYRLVVGLPEGASYKGASVRALYTMWESTEIPQAFRSWVPHLKRSNLVLVPAPHSYRVIKDAVPDLRVVIVPLVTDANDWPYVERKEHDTFTFLTVGDLSVRKGFEMLYDCFWKAFEGRNDVRLVLKSRAGSDLTQIVFWPKRVPEPEYAGVYEQVRSNDVYLTSKHDDLVLCKDRVRYYVRADPEETTLRILRSDWRKASILKLYQMCDCFVWPSRGEGWGYPPREAAATGMPVITCAHTGMVDAEEWAMTIPYNPIGMKAWFRHWGGQCGFFAEPDWDSLIDTMRWVVDNRDKARVMGELASRIVTERTINDLGRDLLHEMAEVA